MTIIQVAIFIRLIYEHIPLDSGLSTIVLFDSYNEVIRRGLLFFLSFVYSKGLILGVESVLKTQGSVVQRIVSLTSS